MHWCASVSIIPVEKTVFFFYINCLYWKTTNELAILKKKGKCKKNM